MERKIRAYERVKLARASTRPRAKDFIKNLFQRIIYLKGDRNFGDSKSIIGGIAEFESRPITFIGIQKGAGIEEGVETNFGMPNPEGYRKAKRLMQQAEKFNRPIITFIDTPGAYPGIDAEERGQFEAIASNLAFMSSLEVPVISIIIGEGGSGGALALSIANRLYMLENAVFSILSPEGFASILWKDSGLAAVAAEKMKITAKDLKEFEIIDDYIPELEDSKFPGIEGIKEILQNDLKILCNMKGAQLKKERFEKFRTIGR